MLTDKQRSLIRGLTYPVQFEKNPKDGIERVLRRVVYKRALDATPEEYLAAIRAGLTGTEELSKVIPQDHPESVVRSYLAEVQRHLEKTPAPAEASRF